MALKSILISVCLTLSLFVSSQNSEIDGIIKSKIDKGLSTKSIAADGIILFSQNILPSHYEKTNYGQSWKDMNNVEELLGILRDSHNEGLTPSDYHLERINNLISELSVEESDSKSADLDLILTDAAIMYAVHLIVGKVDQNKIRAGWDIPKAVVPEVYQGYLEEALVNKQLNSMINKLKPDHYMYKHLRNGLRNYRNIADIGGWPTIPKGQVLKLDVKDSRNFVLSEYLSITGDLDTSNESSSDSVFDLNLENAVKRFQFRHNLNQDGVVGKGTLAIMNIPVEQRIDEIRISLERARWVLHYFPDDFLVVNIAGFNIRRIIGDSTVFYSRVIVGKHFHETPIFDGTLTYIELNPTWTLPYSIATKETLPKLQSDPNYLRDKNMIIMNKDGKELDPATIDFNKLSKNNFPYTLRQKAGPNNALGEVKFMFPNSYSVYLHDTPARSLFSREDRAFSHGCIRLDKKWELFLNLMGSEWDMAKIDNIIASGETTTVKLKKPIRIMLLYWTAGADKNDVLYFDKDIYDRDPEVLEELNKPMKFKSERKL